ncbi:MAG: heme o synthase [Thermoanaerobaculum sp.]|nr:heme o synthase [Thermoanaerobaculum sp.]
MNGRGFFTLAAAVWRDHWELVKGRLALLVVFSAGSGYALASGPSNPTTLVATLVGTFLAAAGALALNQALEVERDRLMARTASRPLVTGALPRWYGYLLGVVLALAGLTLLAAKTRVLAALLGLAVVVLYVFVYTPLKSRSPYCTLVGAVCGALPPMMGWSAASGGLSLGAVLLAALLFFWQVPHFLSLAWLFREDYSRGGFRMLPQVDPGGSLTGRLALLYALATVGTTAALVLAQLTGLYFAAGALILGVLLVVPAWRLAQAPNDRRARGLFRMTLAYLPLLMALMVWDRGPVTSPFAQEKVSQARVERFARD